jgi:hypothetical protein
MIFSPEIIAAGCAGAAILISFAVGLFSLKQRAVAIRGQAELRSEFENRIAGQHTECSVQIAQLAENVAVLEMSAQQIADAQGGLTRSIRSQAMQLLRTGMSPENAASALGMSRNEVRLLACVSKTLRL